MVVSTMERNELTSPRVEKAPAARMSEPLSTARKLWEAPSVLPVSVDEITRAGGPGTTDSTVLS